MAWLGKVSLGGFPDLADAVTKLSESVKNIEKNFDSALGLEEKPEPAEASEIWHPPSDRRALFDPVMALMGQKGRESSIEPSEKAESLQPSQIEVSSSISTEGPQLASTQIVSNDKEVEEIISSDRDAAKGITDTLIENAGFKSDPQLLPIESEAVSSYVIDQEMNVSALVIEQNDATDQGPMEPVQSHDAPSRSSNAVDQLENSDLPRPDEPHCNTASPAFQDEQKTDAIQYAESNSPEFVYTNGVKEVTEPEVTDSFSVANFEVKVGEEPLSDSSINVISLTDSENTAPESILSDSESQKATSESMEGNVHADNVEDDNRGQHLHSELKLSDSPGNEIEKVKMEVKMMETALQGAARQAQAKADEIAKLMNENELLKATIAELKKRPVEPESDSMREEYLQKVASLERKVYALTKERDTLRREQSRKSDAAALLKEKDEIINQVMAEGEELSKKQAAQESTIRKLRAQIRELDEEKQRLNSKLQVEETRVESIKRDKAATEKLLQETIEKSQAELAAQKEFYVNALNAAKEAEALAEARANNEARTELESRLKEAGEREATLVQALEELRQTLSRTEQQAVFREDMLRRDIDDLQRRYQASELRCEELISQVPDSTRPLLRQIEAMQETTARKAEAWAGVERTLNSRLQEAEAKAAAAEEKERSMNERLSQTLSRMAVLEAQVSCLRAEQTQLSRSLEKERQRASETRQEYLAAVEAAATHEGRAKQFEDEIKELRLTHKQELQQEFANRELLEKELERERASKIDLEMNVLPKMSLSNKSPTKLTSLSVDNGSVSIRKLPSSGGMSNMDESYFLHASLDSSDDSSTERKFHSEAPVNSYFLKSMTPSTFEATLRQKDGEIASYMSRLTTLESIRDSLAEELVKMTEQCEKLRAEAVVLPGIRAELESLRRRHTAALELMGERDEELEELRADIIDMKEMYREQVDLLVNKIQRLSSSPVYTS